MAPSSNGVLMGSIYSCYIYVDFQGDASLYLFWRNDDETMAFFVSKMLYKIDIGPLLIYRR